MAAQVFQIADFRAGKNLAARTQKKRGRRNAAPAKRAASPAINPARQERLAKWREVDARRRFCEARHALAVAVLVMVETGHRDEMSCEAFVEEFVSSDAVPFALEEMLAATVAQLRTPVGDYAGIVWKRTRKNIRFLGSAGLWARITKDEVKRIAEADEAWLAQEPRRKPRAGKGGAE